MFISQYRKAQDIGRLTVFVKTDRHHSIGCIEGLLDTIAMMHVDIDIQNSFVVSQQLQNSQDNI